MMYRTLGSYILHKAQHTGIGRAVWTRVRQYPAIKEKIYSIRARLEGPPRDLDAVASLALPENTAFRLALPEIDRIEGMFTHFSMAVIDALLSYQNEIGIAGNMLEFGVFKGRSAALMGRHLNSNERLVLVDNIDHLNRDAIARFRAAVDFLVCATEDFRKTYADFNKRRRSFRFIHIDASHDFRATFRELKMADDLLAENGIIAMDDFANLHYSQNIASIFKYLFTANTDLTIFMVTDEKAYLCRRSALVNYAPFVLDRMLAEVASRGSPACLARTDVDPEYRAFYLRPRKTTEGNCFYGWDVMRYRRMLQWP